MSNRLDQEREKRLQPARVKYARERLEELGFVSDVVSGTLIKFKHKGHVVTLYPYSGWFTGKSVKDGRGFNNLLKQLKK